MQSTTCKMLRNTFPKYYLQLQLTGQLINKANKTYRKNAPQKIMQLQVAHRNIISCNLIYNILTLPEAIYYPKLGFNY